MKRWDYINSRLREFETYLSDRIPKPFQVVRADDKQWSSEEAMRLQPDGYPRNLTGVYIYVDVCTADDIHGTPADGDDRYSVIRKLGSATNSFYDRVRKAHWRQPGGAELLFRHRWIDIVPIPLDLGFVTLALEDFLLKRVRTDKDTRGVPKQLRSQSPIVFDEAI